MSKLDETIVAKGMELLEKYQPKTTLSIKSVQDDSSVGPEGEEGTQLKVLHLTEQFTGTGSIPTNKGILPTIKSDKIYCAGEDLALLAVGIQERDGKLFYDGVLKVDVSRPKYGRRNGVIAIIAPSRLWLTSVSFARKGRQLSQANRLKIQSETDKLFDSSVAVDMDAYMKDLEEKVKKERNALTKPNDLPKGVKPAKTEAVA
jgi:hypothetical protein